MARPKLDLGKLIALIPDHVTSPPPESESPILHYRHGASRAGGLIKYFDRKAGEAGVYKVPYGRKLSELRSLVLSAYIETFERFLKELAVFCVNQVGPLALDERLSKFSVSTKAVAAQFEAGDLGRALAEGDTWFDCNKTNERFRELLAGPRAAFEFFPGGKDPDAWRRRALEILWQLRHSIVHNVGVITRSDAAKLRLLRRAPVSAPKVLDPTDEDMRYAARFLDETADWSNARVAKRLADVLTDLHADDPTLFDPASRAQEVADTMQVTVTIASAAASP